MLRIFKKSLLTGVVTSRYPAVPEQAAVGFRGKPELDSKRCNACGACVVACPSGAIRVEEASCSGDDRGNYRLELSLDYCVFCGACAEACSPGAIVLGREFELAARDRADLQLGMWINKSTDGKDAGLAVNKAVRESAESQQERGGQGE
jgi:formate hydrogenlyase subunit 6/NADH:ubiquinone oxidoreductase subunit I